MAKLVNERRQVGILQKVNRIGRGRECPSSLVYVRLTPSGVRLVKRFAA